MLCRRSVDWAASVTPAAAATLWQDTLALWNRIDKPMLTILTIIIGIATLLPEQIGKTLTFAGESLLNIAPWLAISVALAGTLKPAKPIS